MRERESLSGEQRALSSAINFTLRFDCAARSEKKRRNTGEKISGPEMTQPRGVKMGASSAAISVRLCAMISARMLIAGPGSLRIFHQCIQLGKAVPLSSDAVASSRADLKSPVSAASAPGCVEQNGSAFAHRSIYPSAIPIITADSSGVPPRKS